MSEDKLADPGQRGAPKKILLVTGNRHKMREFSALLGGNVHILGLSDIGFKGAIVENGRTFEENARIKVRAMAADLPYPVIADDSGLEVDALGGAPGIFSARFAGEGAGDAANRAKLLRLLGDRPDREARFVCVLCLRLPSGEEFLFRGACEGRIAQNETGAGGFGYDPLFIPHGQERTFAELEEAEKNAISHRGRAVAELLPMLHMAVRSQSLL